MNLQISNSIIPQVEFSMSVKPLKNHEFKDKKGPLPVVLKKII